MLFNLALAMRIKSSLYRLLRIQLNRNLTNAEPRHSACTARDEAAHVAAEKEALIAGRTLVGLRCVEAYKEEIE